MQSSTLMESWSLLTQRMFKRRTVVQGLGAVAAVGIAGCGGGSDSAGTSGTSSNAAASSASSSAASRSSSSAASSSASSATSGASSSASSTNTALWGNTGWDATPSYTSTVSYPTLADFAAVTPPSSGTYTFRIPKGCNNATQNRTYTDSSSGNSVTIVCSSAGESVTLNYTYYMGKYLVTNANWRAYCDATGSTTYPSYWVSGQYPAGRENYPAMGLSYNQAAQYASWLSTYLGKTVTVPTEAQWEWAALGATGVANAWVYPWGTASGFNSSTGASAGVVFGGGSIKSLFNCNVVCLDRALISGMTTLTYYSDTVVTGGTGYDASTDTAVLTSVTSLTYSSGTVSGWQHDADNDYYQADFANSDQFRRVKDVWGGYTTPVGFYEGGKSWCGCYDMSGNAFEWTSSSGLATNGLEAGSTAVMVVKGGSWYTASNSGSCIMRGEGRLPSSSTFSIGFRVCYL